MSLKTTSTKNFDPYEETSTLSFKSCTEIVNNSNDTTSDLMYTTITNQHDESLREENLPPDYQIQFSENLAKSSNSKKRRRKESKNFILALFFFAIIGIGCILSFLIENNFYQIWENEKNSSSRPDHPFSPQKRGIDGEPIVNCSPLAVNQFPQDIFNQSERREGAVLIHCLIVVYMFLGLAIVCDEFFVPTLEAICEGLNLNDDVAGATFMAVGSSTPELFTSVIAVFITKDDIGVGTIVGSAVFNIVFIISLCGLLTDAPINLSWYPLIRDCSFYSLSIVALVFVIYDQTVSWYEALAMLSLYALYIVLMYVNEGLASMADSFALKCCPAVCCPKSLTLFGYTDVALSENGEVLEPFLNGDVEHQSTPPTKKKEKPQFETLDLEADEKELLNGDYVSHKNGSPNGKVQKDHESTNQTKNGMRQSNSTEKFALDDSDQNDNSNDDDYEENDNEQNTTSDETSNLLSYPTTSSLWSRIIWVLSAPLNIMLSFSVPDVRKYPGRLSIVFFSFVLSTCWIAAFSYMLVWMVTIIGYTLGISDTIMGLTLLAAGTSVPDAMSSVIVARNGQGDMAVSNSIGSNIFDILLCLGLPWALKSFKSPVIINSSGLTYISFTLITTVLLIVLIIMANRWVLNKKLGCILLIAYLLFIVYASLVETNTFGYVNPPSCDY